VRGPNQIRRRESGHSSTQEKQAQELAITLASRQVMRVPWNRFRQAHDEYVRWEAFALWVRAIVDVDGCVPPSVVAVLKKRCADFIEQAAHLHPPELVALRLHEWIHNHVFTYAKQEGWLDALHFYGVRDPRCEAAWAHWEPCTQEWKRNRLRVYPAFETWWRAAQDRELFQEVSADRVLDVVETYVDWMAFVQWLRPLLGSDVKPASQVVRELRRRCPDFLTVSLDEGPNRQDWRSLTSYIEERFFPEVKKEGWLDYVREKACHHPRNVRALAYGERWMNDCSVNPALLYPRFSRWRYAADNFCE
jgi:hypothetical protein